MTVHSHNMKPLIINISVKFHQILHIEKELQVINFFQICQGQITHDYVTFDVKREISFRYHKQ